MMKQETTVLIVGAGPAGLATSACLNLQKIRNIVLEREDCNASLWRKRAYGRLKLHLAKQFCELPYLPFPSDAPTYVPRNDFIRYLDHYVSDMDINPLYERSVVSATFVHEDGKWAVVVENTSSVAVETYVAPFLVVATGENGEGYVPPVPGLDTFTGEVMHSSRYKNGHKFQQKRVLVVGSGNSGMEIALDLSNYGANSSIVVRSPVHVLNEGMVRLGMTLLGYLPINMVDNLVMALSKLKNGDLSGYGIIRPSKGPFYLKKQTGRSPVLDVGTIDKIRAHQIQPELNINVMYAHSDGDLSSRQFKTWAYEFIRKSELVKVFPSITKIAGKNIHFKNGQNKNFDAIVFATGYRSTVLKWLKDDGGLFGKDGMPKISAPNHWKGEKGLYCAGFSRAGLFGISNDAKAIAKDVNAILNNHT